MKPDRVLILTLAVVAIVQTAMPVVGQKLSRAIVYDQLLHGAIVICGLTAIAVAVYHVKSRCFSSVALSAFYVGLALLLVFDFWIKRAIQATV